MKNGPFISLVSVAFNIPEKSVFVIARALREAGYLTSGARGVNAPHMTFTDAARLSIALLTGEPASRLMDVFEVYKDQKLRQAPSASNPFFELLKLTSSATLEETIVALFKMLASPDPDIYARYGNKIRPVIEFNDRVRHARILFGGEELIFHNEALERKIEISYAESRAPMAPFEGRAYPGSKEYDTLRRNIEASLEWQKSYEMAHGFKHGMNTTRAMDVGVLHQIADGMTHDDS